MWEVYRKQHLRPRKDKVIWVNRECTSLQPIQKQLLRLAAVDLKLTEPHGSMLSTDTLTGHERKEWWGEAISSNLRIQADFLLVYTMLSLLL